MAAARLTINKNSPALLWKGKATLFSWAIIDKTFEYPYGMSDDVSSELSGNFSAFHDPDQNGGDEDMEIETLEHIRKVFSDLRFVNFK